MCTANFLLESLKALAVTSAGLCTCSHQSGVLQVQVALGQRQFDKAASLLEEGLLQHNPDDWSGYLLLMACRLPATAMPLHDAAEGFFAVQHGFCDLQKVFNQKFWDAAAQEQSGSGVQPAALSIQSVIDQAAAKVQHSLVCKLSTKGHALVKRLAILVLLKQHRNIVA